MGRLGFNFLRLKERKKQDAEAGAASSQERNESAELDEFVEAIEEKNRQIKSIRILLLTALILVIVMGTYIVFTQPRTFRKGTSNEEIANAEIIRLQELNNQYSNKIDEQEAQIRTLNACKINLEAIRQLKIKRDEDKGKEKENYDKLKSRFGSLQAEYNELKNKYEQLLNENAQSQLEEFSEEIKNSMQPDESKTNEELNDFSKLVDEIEKVNSFTYPDLWRRISELS